MPARRKLPSDSILEAWLNEGLSHKQIRDRIQLEFGEDVKLSSVSSHLSRIGATNRVRYDDSIPWGRISSDHNHCYQITMLRIEARLRRGETVREVDRERFQRWRQELTKKGVVVHYDYNTVEGFWYVPARPGIDTGLVRRPEVVSEAR